MSLCMCVCVVIVYVARSGCYTICYHHPFTSAASKPSRASTTHSYNAQITTRKNRCILLSVCKNVTDVVDVPLSKYALNFRLLRFYAKKLIYRFFSLFAPCNTIYIYCHHSLCPANFGTVALACIRADAHLYIYCRNSFPRDS